MAGLVTFLIRQLNVVSRATADAAFVRVHEIEHGKKRLARLAMFPVRLATPADVPGVGRCREIVILFRLIGAKLAGATQIGREGPNAIGQRCVATHVLRTDRRSIHARDQRRAGRGAHAGWRKGLRVTHTARGQSVEIRGDGLRIAVTTQVGTDVLAGDPQDVRTFRLAGFRLNARKRRQNHHHGEQLERDVAGCRNSHCRKPSFIRSAAVPLATRRAVASSVV